VPLLRPGGFMLIGLYSQVARRHVLRARRSLAEYDSTAEQIGAAARIFWPQTRMEISYLS